MTSEQQTVELSPEAVYFRQKFHASEDQNAILAGELARTRATLVATHAELAAMKAKEPAKKAAAKKPTPKK